MENFEIKNGDAQIEYIDSPEKLKNLVKILNSTCEFAFDTEFDRFHRKYGFTLELLQIFDGSVCYLVDPIKIKSLVLLWKVFENPGICKIAYSCKEDIEILMRRGCKPKNIFDIQVSAKLCNRPSNSFVGLVKSEFDIDLDKSEQTSNWSFRPLKNQQLVYASNDVIHLLKLKNIFFNDALNKGVMEMLEEENKSLETQILTDFIPKLSNKQIQTYSEHHRQKLLELFILRDKMGQENNIPPKYLFPDSLLEEIVKDKRSFLSCPFKKGFDRRILKNENFKSEFLKIIDSIDESIDYKNIPNYQVSNQDKWTIKEDKERILNEVYLPIAHEVISRFGKDAGDCCRTVSHLVVTSLVNGFQRNTDRFGFYTSDS